MPLPASLASLNKAAVAAARQGEHALALERFDLLVATLHQQHLTHPELHVAFANRAATHLALQQYDQALQDAQQCIGLLRKSAAARGQPASRQPFWPKACQRLGDALAGLGQHKQAAAAYEAGLAADPCNAALKAGLATAQQGAISDILSGKGLDRRALPAPPAPCQITNAPHNASSSSLLAARSALPLPGLGTSSGSGVAGGPGDAALLGPGQLHAVGWTSPADELLAGGANGGGGSSSSALLLPAQLLTPAAVQADTALRDVFEYVKTQCDIRAPQQYLHRQLPDSFRLGAWSSATSAAVRAVRNSGRTARVLLLGAKAGLLALAALEAGATHVTCVEGCPHLAQACQQLLFANGAPSSRFSVTSSHPTALRLGSHLPAACNVLVADLIDDAVLSGGFIPAIAHALAELMAPQEEPVIVPAAVTVMAQAVGVRSTGCWVGGEGRAEAAGGGGGFFLDASALDKYSQALPAPLDPSWLLPLSAPLRVWHLLSRSLAADVSALTQLDVELAAAGGWCCMAVWAELQLGSDGINISTAGPWEQRSQAFSQGSDASAASAAAAAERGHCTSYQPGLCWLEGTLGVQAGEVYPLLACHNTVRMAFGLQEADYQQLFSPEPSLPHAQFGMASDGRRLTAYHEAMKAAIARSAAAKQQQQQQCGQEEEQTGEAPVKVHVLDVGCGSGVLSCLAVAAARAVSGAGAGTGVAGGVGAREVVSNPCSSSSSTGGAGDASAAAEDACSSSSSSSSSSSGNSPVVEASVVGVELVAPLAAVAQRTAVLNGCGAAVSIVHSDAGALQRGQPSVPPGGFDLLVVDCFDSVLVGHQVCHLIELVKARLLAEGAQVLPASASLFVMGIELQHIRDAAHRTASASAAAVAVAVANGADKEGGSGESRPLDLSALDQFRWSGEPQAVLLDRLPHKQLTRAVKAFDFDFCAPSSPAAYPSQALVGAEVLAPGLLNAVAVWFDLQLDATATLTSAPAGFQAGGRRADAASNNRQATSSPQQAQGQRLAAAALRENNSSSVDAAGDCRALVLHASASSQADAVRQGSCAAGDAAEQQHQQRAPPSVLHHWGQGLIVLDWAAAVQPGDELQLAVTRTGPVLAVELLGGTPGRFAPRAAAGCTPPAAADAGAVVARQLQLLPAARPAWLRPGAGIEDPAVWAVKKAQQLLAQMLQRAPGCKFPPIFRDLAVLQVHAGSLGLPPGLVAAVTQELCMREALAVAAQRQVAVSSAATPEAAGLKPPLLWQ